MLLVCPEYTSFWCTGNARMNFQSSPVTIYRWRLYHIWSLRERAVRLWLDNLHHIGYELEKLQKVLVLLSLPIKWGQGSASNISFHLSCWHDKAPHTPGLRSKFPLPALSTTTTVQTVQCSYRRVGVCEHLWQRGGSDAPLQLPWIKTLPEMRLDFSVMH